MPDPRHANPDHHLAPVPDGGRPTREQGRAAWEATYAQLDAQLAAQRAAGRADTALVVVCGLQGSGKSHWVAAQLAVEPDAVFLDAALPSRGHRERAIALARRHGVPVRAVWIEAPLALALARNAGRHGAARVPDEVIHHVHEQVERPSCDEGFDTVEVVDGRGPLSSHA